jgi:hypothetical protein
MASRLKLEDIEKKLSQLKAQKEAILSKSKEQERKTRTKRLIEIGAIIEKGLKIDTKYKAMACVEYLKKYDDNFSKLVEYMEKKEVEIKEQEEKTKSETLPGYWQIFDIILR